MRDHRRSIIPQRITHRMTSEFECDVFSHFPFPLPSCGAWSSVLLYSHYLSYSRIVYALIGILDNGHDGHNEH